MAMFRFAYFLCGNRHLAEDLVQDAFEKLWKGWERHYWKQLDPAFGGTNKQAFNAVKSALVDRMRRKSESERPADFSEHDEAADFSVETSALFNETIRELVQALLELEEIYRELLVAIYFDDMSLPKAAAKVGLTQSTARRYEKQALKILRKKLEGQI
ncbi:hypothetical protein KPATCC21470_5674 [Kitasatospora purpeofusca]